MPHLNIFVPGDWYGCLWTLLFLNGFRTFTDAVAFGSSLVSSRPALCGECTFVISGAFFHLISSCADFVFPLSPNWICCWAVFVACAAVWKYLHGFMVPFYWNISSLGSLVFKWIIFFWLQQNRLCKFIFLSIFFDKELIFLYILV